MIESQKLTQNVPFDTDADSQRHIDPLGDGISSLDLVRASGSDVDIVNAARVSFGKFVDTISERDRNLIKFLMEHAHTSPFEHNQLSFRVKAPIFVARQWMRHRMNSYNEISYRYVKAPLEFYVPVKWRKQDTVNKQASVGSYDDDIARINYTAAIQTCINTYEELLARGVCRELARGILPVCTYTQYIFTCNLHSLMHFLALRLHAGAQYEIRQYALGMLKLALPHFPISLGEWRRIHGAKLDITEDLFTQEFSKSLE